MAGRRARPRGLCIARYSCGYTGILYEMIGHQDGFPLLWQEACRGRRRMLVNDESGSTSQCWLAATYRFDMAAETARDVAAVVGADRHGADAARWYIPYFDRI